MKEQYTLVTPHHGEAMHRIYRHVHCDGIQKWCTIFVDNASSADVATLKLMRKSIDMGFCLMVNGCNVRCFAHILNLILTMELMMSTSLLTTNANLWNDFLCCVAVRMKKSLQVW